MPPAQASSKRPMIIMGLLLAALAGGLWFSRNLTSPVEETGQRLEKAKAAVLAYAREKGQPPTALDALVTAGYLDAIPEDRSGHALVYTLLDDGQRAELKSLGPDGKEGGFMFKRDHSITFKIPLPVER